jgi:hypothetical protein
MHLISGIDYLHHVQGDLYFTDNGHSTRARPLARRFTTRKDAAFGWLRYGWPWSLVETAPGVFDWRELDLRLGFAREIGLEICLVIGISIPDWIVGPRNAHAALAPQLAERMALYTEALMTRYEPKSSFPSSKWRWKAPAHNFRPLAAPSSAPPRFVLENAGNLHKAFEASSQVIRAHGGRVLACEPVSDIEKTVPIRDSIDLMGLDYYPHFTAKSRSATICIWRG